MLCAVQLQFGVDESYKLSIPSHGTQVYAHIEVSVSFVNLISGPLFPSLKGNKLNNIFFQ